MSFKPTQHHVDQTIKCIELCIVKPSVGARKSEFVLIGSNQQLSKVNVRHITIGDSDISPATKVRNLGVILDSSLSLNHHVSSIVRSASFHIRTNW